MSRKRRKGGRVTPKRTRPRHWADGSAPPPSIVPPNDLPGIAEFFVAVSNVLATDFLHERNGFVDYRGWAGNVVEAIVSGELHGPLGEIVVELMDDEEVTAAFARSNVVDVVDVSPVSLLRRAKLIRAVELSDDMREQGFLMCELQVETGEAISAVIYVDFLGGISAIDIHLVPKSLATLISAANGDGIHQIEGRSPSEVKRRAHDALDMARRTIPQPDGEGWPGELLAVETVFRQIPGALLPDTDWEPALSPDEQKRFIADFVASPEASALALSQLDIEQAVDTILWFKLGYGNESPTLWGVTQAGYFLGGFLLRKVYDADSIRHIITVLPHLIEWSHRTTGVSAQITDEVLEMVRVETAHAELELELELSVDSAEVWWTNRLVGGEEAFANLTAEPLPLNEPLDASAVVVVHRDEVSQIADVVVDVVEELFPEDGEMVTSALRIVAFFAERVPDVLVRGKHESAAAALVYLAMCANRRSWSVTKKAIAEAAGLSASASFSNRCHTFCRAVDMSFSEYVTAFGDASLLTSEFRKQILDEAT